MRSLTLAAIAAALAVPTAPASAQEGERTTAISTLIVAHTYPQEGQMRGAGPVGDPDSWLTPADIPEPIRTKAQGQSAGPRHQIALAQVGIELTVETGGSVSECRGIYGQADLAPPLCVLIRQRGKFRHALAADGSPIRSTAQLTVQYSINGPGGNTGLPLAPPPSVLWPVRAYPYKVTMERAPKWAKFSRARDGSTTAILLRFYNFRAATCITIRPSGDAALDRATCAAAMTGTYRTDPALSYQSLPMVVRWDRDGAKALLPVQSEWQRPVPENEAELTVRGVKGDAGATAWLSLSETGAVTRCTIERSAGNDAADVAMCRTFRAARFIPSRDVFGLPVASSYRAAARFE